MITMVTAVVLLSFLYRKSLHVHICARAVPTEWQRTHLSGGEWLQLPWCPKSAWGMDWCVKNVFVFLFWLLMTMTFYLHVCSHAQDWSMLSQSSVTSLVQQGLSYCTHTDTCLMNWNLIKLNTAHTHPDTCLMNWNLIQLKGLSYCTETHLHKIKTGERVEYKKKGGECQGDNGVQIEPCIMVRETPGFCRWL